LMRGGIVSSSAIKITRCVLHAREHRAWTNRRPLAFLSIFDDTLIAATLILCRLCVDTVELAVERVHE